MWKYNTILILVIKHEMKKKKRIKAIDALLDKLILKDSLKKLVLKSSECENSLKDLWIDVDLLLNGMTTALNS